MTSDAEHKVDRSGWWLGFDCVHLGDAHPSGRSVRFGNETYKTMAYVRAQTERLAEQMAAVAP